MIDRIKRIAVKNKVFSGLIYLCYRVVGVCLSVLYLVMRIFPVKKNKVVCCATKGKRYGDNPKYISDELLRRNKDYEIVWLLRENVEDDIPDRIQRKNYGLLKNIYELATAQVWIDSNLKELGFLKRKKQLYIQTWHGSYGLKKIGYDLEEKLPLIDRPAYIYNSKRTDIMVSNSKRTSEIYRSAFRYDGTFLECGSPRNDIFFEDDASIIDKVRTFFGLTSQHIVLYAPTFRSDYGTDNFKLDFERLKGTLESRFGGEWVVLIRLHPLNLSDAESFIEYNGSIINASDYSVMQELLVASDILVTDYSSCMFDFVTTPKPCFLYATDAEKYKRERDYYFELEELPFPVAFNNDELVEIIMNFDDKQYDKDLHGLFDRVGLCESGRASQIVADYIEEWMEKN